MNFDRNWTIFALDAEVEAFGTSRIAAAHNKLRAEVAKHQESEFHPDWSMLEATRASLREHMEIIRGLRAEVAALKSELKEISIALNDPADNLIRTTPQCVTELRRDAKRYRWLRNNISYYDVDADWPVEGANIPRSRRYRIAFGITRQTM